MDKSYRDELYSAANAYINRGWSIVPLKTQSKLPQGKWGKEHVTSDTLVNHFSAVSNIGIALGQRSGGLVDLDFDLAEAAIMEGATFSHLPAFGRASKPIGHRLVICDDCEKTVQFQLSESEAKIIGLTHETRMVLEVRSSGAQTMVPPSIHPSGESLTWVGLLPNDIPRVSWAEIVDAASITAFLGVALKMYPRQAGDRNSICLALAGTLLRTGMHYVEVNNLILYLTEKAGDEDSSTRANAESTFRKLEAGEEVTGLPKLCELLSITELEATLHKWLYGSKVKAKRTAQVAKEPATSVDAETKLQELNKDYLVVGSEGGKCRVVFFERRAFEKGQMRDVMVMQSFADFNNRFMNQHVTIQDRDEQRQIRLGKFWLEHPKRRQYDQIEFLPAQEAPSNIYNLWRGFQYEPKNGSWMPLLRHVWYVLAKEDRASFQYIMRWAAWAVQNPADHAEVALVFRGGKGTGKGTFCRWLKILFGQHGLQIFSSKHIVGRFNSHLRDCVLLFADEAIAPSDKDAEAVLKGMLTEPSLAIEGKGRDVVQARNHLHVMMASNATWVVPASFDERRFAVFEVSTAKHGDTAWFNDIHYNMTHGGAEAMLYFLLNLKLDGWHPRQNVPSNSALNNQRAESLQGAEKLWLDYLSVGEIVGQQAGQQVIVSTIAFAEAAKCSARRAAAFLKAMGCLQERNRRPSGWIVPALGEARANWNKNCFKVEWTDEEHWIALPVQPPF
ncbi:MAG: bifunctional DNA primase/polymerase [Alphaproteobacteria bacterium]|nr:bifunctional DNA primase/polymerase [Alphaproteobacteria bacterium]